nr:hypothetical protein GCM10020093_018610 [Planobispora longispora]
MRNRSDDRAVTPSITWWQRWASWAGPVASGAAAAYGCVLLVAALMGYRSFLGVTDLGLPDVTWPGAAVLLVGSVVAAATVRPRGARVPPVAVSAGAWGVAVLALAGSCWVLLNLIQLVLTGTVTDRHGDSDWVTFAERLCLAVVGALFAATALAHSRRRAASVLGAAGRIRRRHRAGGIPRRTRRPRGAADRLHRLLRVPSVPGSARPRRGRCPRNRAGWIPAGLVHGAGGGLRRRARRVPAAGTRPAVGHGLPRWTPWLAGRRVPRFLPLTPVWVVAPTLALYGTGSGILAGAGILGDGLFGIGGAASLAFGGYGWALAVAAVSYQLRTRPLCVPTAAL